MGKRVSSAQFNEVEAFRVNDDIVLPAQAHITENKGTWWPSMVREYLIDGDVEFAGVSIEEILALGRSRSPIIDLEIGVGAVLCSLLFSICTL